MSDKFNEQKAELESLYKEIKLLAQQVRFLLVNGRAMDLLDLDVMMNRTHAIYDKICAMSAVHREGTEGEDDLFDDLFWEKCGDSFFSEEKKEEPEEDAEETDQVASIETPEDNTAKDEEEATDFGFIFRAEEGEENGDGELSEIIGNGELSELKEEEKEEKEELSFDFNISAGEIEEPEIEENGEEKVVGELSELSELKELKEEERTEKEEERTQEKNVYTTGDQIEMVIPHFEIEMEDMGEQESVEEETLEEEQEELSEEQKDLIEEQEDLVVGQEKAIEEQEELIEEQEESIEEQEESVEELEESIEEPVEETIEEQEEEQFPYEPVMFGEMAEQEDLGFEKEDESFEKENELAFEKEDDLSFEKEEPRPEILGERLQEEDHSLAAKLQHKPVRDLRTAIGINDKFLLVNELFGGNMERYNKSIENLNDLPTLDGALGYMDELYVQYQWNRNNEAYKKLMELVRRKFGEN